MRKLLLLAWLPLVIFLFPLPPEAARQLQNEINRPSMDQQSTVAGAAKQNARQQASPEQLDMFASALWAKWMQTLGLLAVGLLVGVMAWRDYRHWQWAALGMSILYLVLVLSRYLLMERAVPDSWLFFETGNNFLRAVQGNVRVVEVGISNGSLIRPASIIYNEMLMPLFQVAVLVWLLWLFSRRRTLPQ